MSKINDLYGRKFGYLRLSITDICNFRCSYCLPEEMNFKMKQKEYLSISEIRNLVQAFAELGVTKVRLTGGEPTTRKDFIEIAKTIKAIDGIKHVTLTTNGYKLIKYSKELENIGFSSINVSLDSLNSFRFNKITKRNYLSTILLGINELIKNGIKIKINVVLSKDFSVEDLENFYFFTKYKSIDIRFIDQMETYILKKNNNFISSNKIFNFLELNNWKIENKNKNIDGPASIFKHDEHMGKIGIINPYSNSFCSDCNRLRISSTGKLFLCLFGEKYIETRHLISSSDKKQELKALLIKAVKTKSPSHFLGNKNFGLIKTFSSIGG